MKTKTIIQRLHIEIVKARGLSEANRIIRKKYPRAYVVTYRFAKDYKFVHKDDRDYNSRKMKVVFIKDMRKVREEIKNDY